MQTVEFDPAYDANTNVSTPNNDVMFAHVGKRHALVLTGVIDQFIDHPIKPEEKGARFIVDERHGFQPGFNIILDLEALTMLPDCEGAPCDCHPGAGDEEE